MIIQKLDLYRCPCCNTPLTARTIEGSKYSYVYCAEGTCDSELANDGLDGEEGETPETVAENLIQQLEANPDWKEKDEDNDE
jgi:hypothetical protein